MKKLFIIFVLLLLSFKTNAATLTLAPDPLLLSVSEVGSFTLTRDEGLDNSLFVTLASSDTTVVTVPATVILPLGELSIVFNVTSEGLIGSAFVNASASGFESYTAGVHVVPVPAAFWLFGTALVGFIGFSRRRNVA